MKRILLLATLLFPLYANAQITESFSGPDIVSAHPWEGNTALFSINAAGQLEFTSPEGEAGEASLRLPVAYQPDMSWEFTVGLRFVSSNSNNARIAVYSDDDILYYIQAGNNNGQVSFYSKDGEKTAKIAIKGREELTDNSSLSIRLTLTDGGVWTLYTRKANEADYYEEGSFAMKYEPYEPETFIQLTCRYIKSRISTFWFDDIHLSGNLAEPSPEAPVAELSDIQQIGKDGLQFLFSAPVDISKASCSIDEVGDAISISYGENKSIVNVTFADELESEQTYYLEWANLFDLASGEEIELALEVYFEDEPTEPTEPEDPIQETEPEVEPGEVIFNELLPNPYSGGSEYIELYNRSGRRISLNGLSIGIRKSDGSLRSTYSLSALSSHIGKEGYALLSKDIAAVSSFYFTLSPEALHETALPILANTSSTLVLFRTRDGQVIDEVAYLAQWHAASTKDTRGTSLERIDPDGLSQDASNWTSATPAAGYGTPGYQNSQHNKGDNTATHIELPVLSSDGNYHISYQLPGQGYNCRAFVYALSGQRVAVIAAHDLLSTTGELIWNGKGTDGKRLQTGVYIIYMELYNSNGQTIKYKKPFLVR